jgi:hypothetical protein
VILEGRGGKRQKSQLVRIKDRPHGGCRFLFDLSIPRHIPAYDEAIVASAAPMPKVGVPVELVFTCEGQSEVYLNGKRLAGAGGFSDARIEAYAEHGDNVVAIKVRSDARRPGLIAMVISRERSAGSTRPGARIICLTRPGDWVTVSCPDKVPAEWLADMEKGPDKATKLLEIGGLGTPPWDYMPGEYAGTEARWIWPDATPEQSKGWWLLRCKYEL